MNSRDWWSCETATADTQARSSVNMPASDPLVTPGRTPARHSLRWRLPLVMAALLGFVIAAFLAVAYQQVKANLVHAAGRHVAEMRSPVQQIVELWSTDGRCVLTVAAPATAVDVLPTGSLPSAL